MKNITTEQLKKLAENLYSLTCNSRTGVDYYGKLYAPYNECKVDVLKKNREWGAFFKAVPRHTNNNETNCSYITVTIDADGKLRAHCDQKTWQDVRRIGARQIAKEASNEKLKKEWSV